MPKERKENWNCSECLCQNATTSNTVSPSKEENVTMRRKKHITTPTESESSCQSFSDYDTTSLPDLSTYHCVAEMEELKQQISELKLQLQSANDEIERLTLENAELSSKTRGNDFRINTLKKICKENVTTTKKQGKKAKRQRIKKKKINFTLDAEELQTGQISSECDENESKVTNKIDRFTINQGNSSDLSNKSPQSVKTSEAKENPRRIIIFGSQQCRGLAKATSINRTHSPNGNYQVSSFIKPNAQSEDIVNSMRTEDFGNQDTVVLCLGENDSNPTKL
ncbi:hypothetical protein JYU34_010487 [Plutella xylostella]|uniref:Uncharacterized protein n=1 Tax=Plutella xylostella TaxID=51655 RepID=A0ABQ7QIG8_PLUXY|nr:hypothetical protein JYU34_010487 [Plutella xylostella]